MITVHIEDLEGAGEIVVSHLDTIIAHYCDHSDDDRREIARFLGHVLTKLGHKVEM